MKLVVKHQHQHQHQICNIIFKLSIYITTYLKKKFHSYFNFRSNSNHYLIVSVVVNIILLVSIIGIIVVLLLTWKQLKVAQENLIMKNKVVIACSKIDDYAYAQPLVSKYFFIQIQE